MDDTESIIMSPGIYNAVPLPAMDPMYGMVEASSLGNINAVNGTAILDMQEQHIIQIIATSFSSISLASAICAVYWFCLMRRNFRRDLVLLLIAGGSWKSLWFVVFSAATFTMGTIETKTAFCQRSGYMLQVGFEMCDVAVLFMSMHMYLQIFPPTKLTFFGQDGLYRVRHWVVGLWLLLPNLSAALAFVSPYPAYMAQGGFCSLPLRPIWYRLALFWIPRYLIWIYIVFVAIAISRHVGMEFKVFGQERDSSTSQVMHCSSAKESISADPEKTAGLDEPHSTLGSGTVAFALEGEECAPDDTSSVRRPKSKKPSPPASAKSQPLTTGRRESLPSWVVDPTGSNASLNPFTSQSRSMPSSRRGSRQVNNGFLSEDFALPANSDNNPRRNSNASYGSAKSTGAVSFNEQTTLPPITETQPDPVATSKAPKHSANRALRLRRRAIQRQLRLLFIYPCIYMMLWVFPFVVNIMNYFNHWAQHPIFALKVLQIGCLTIMTFVDVFVFCWRERPWRHIPGSDGTFLGSFMWWRVCFGGAWSRSRRASRAPRVYVPATAGAEQGAGKSKSGFPSKLRNWFGGPKETSVRSSVASSSNRPRLLAHARTFSGGSDRKHLEAERAHERLALERADYEQNRKSLQDRRASVVNGKTPVVSPVKQERKEWFESKQMQEDMMTTKDGSIDGEEELMP